MSALAYASALRIARVLEEHGVPEHPTELKLHQLISFKDSGTRLLISANGKPAEFNPKQAGGRPMVDVGLTATGNLFPRVKLSTKGAATRSNTSLEAPVIA